MKKKFTFLTAVFMLLAFLAVPLGMRGQSTTYTSNVTLPTSGTNVASCVVNINGTSYNGTKLGKGGSGASANVTIPSGTTTLYVHCAGWKGKTSKLTLSTTTSGVTITPSGEWTLTSDDGISNNSPFTLSNVSNASTTYFRAYTLTGVDQSIQVTFEAIGERAVFWGVNAVAGGNTVATPTFSPDGGVYTSAQSVSISTTTSGATIYYTTNGNDPTTSSSVYSSPISVSTNTTIKAMATASGHSNSLIATANYVFLEHAGTATDPYSVADARAAIDANSGITNVYATGIVCTGGSSLSSGALNYWISDDGTETNTLEAYKGKGIGGAAFTSTDDIQVGDVVVIKGNLTKYSSTYEFAAGNELVSLTRKGITVDPTTIDLTYVVGNGPASADLTITGTGLTQAFTATITEGTSAFEMTDGTNTGTSLTIPAAGDLIEVRLKAGLDHGDYTGTLTLHSEELSNNVVVTLTGSVTNQTYDIVITQPAIGGTISADKASAEAGATVTLTATPDAAYNFGSWTVLQDDMVTPVTVENDQFTMPACDVLVTATFVENLNVTYDFTDVNNFFTDNTYQTHPTAGTGNSHTNVGTLYYNNATHDQFTASGTDYYFSTSGYFMLGQSGALFNLPTFTGNRITQVIVHSSSSHSTSVQVAIVSGSNTAAEAQTWAHTSTDYTYDIPLAYQTSPLSIKVTNSKNAQFIGITLVRELPLTTPTLAINPSTVDLTSFEAADGTLTVTAANFELTDVSTSEIEYYDYDNVNDEYVAATQPSWITVTCNSPYTTVGYSLEANDGAARTAYFKLHLTYGTTNDEIRSDIVSITQGEFVVDYATLPFAFDGGKADIASVLGLTQEGLDSDYPSSPKLKFNTTDDWLILKLDEAPTSLSYDIKGNGFSGGTFDVLTSADGTTYQSLATYTELGATQSVTFLDLASTVRYIKWIYTNKSSGNVALGNIHASTNYDIYSNLTVDHLNIPIDKVCTIYSDATLNIGINGLSNEGNATNLIIKDGGQLYTPSAVSGTVEKYIIGYGSSTATNGYYLVSAPAKTMMTWIEHTDAYHFDASCAEEEWRNIRQANGPWHISADTPALYASQEDRTLSFNGYGVNAGTVVNSDLPATNAGIDVPVSFNSGKPFQGLNLVGNPYTCKAYLSDGRTFYRMNSNGSGFISATGAINVCEGVLVETASGEYNLTFTTTNPAATSTGNNNSMINISLSQVVNRGEQTLVDNALIRFSEGNTMHKFSLSDNTAKVYFTEGNQDYAVIRSEARGEMPVNFKAAETGTYTLSVEAENLDVEYLHLIDNMTGMDVDLLQTPSYTFEGKRSDYASRFRLVFSANTANENDDFAFISNGQIILNNIDADATVQIIDALGRMITSANANNRVYTDNMASGVYVLRLINGNDVKTQKIVVR